MVFETRGINYLKVGYTFRNLVIGIERLIAKRDLDEFEKKSFRDIRTMINEKFPSEVYRKYEKTLKNKNIGVLAFNSILITALEEKDLSLIREDKLFPALEAFKYLANYYVLKVQGINVD